MLALTALLACSGGPAADAKGQTPTETAHPVAPEAYADVWDVDSLGCEDATVYWAFQGAIDDAGELVGEETWYWFFAEEGWDADCADTFDVTAIEEPTPVADDACISCDRDFTARYALTDDKRGCPLDGYESLFDNDTRDRIDEELYTIALMIDAQPLGGEPGEVNVWSYAQDDQSATTWHDRGVALGTLPDEASTGGAGALTWVVPDGTCVTIEEDEE